MQNSTFNVFIKNFNQVRSIISKAQFNYLAQEVLSMKIGFNWWLYGPSWSLLMWICRNEGKWIRAERRMTEDVLRRNRMLETRLIEVIRIWKSMRWRLLTKSWPENLCRWSWRCGTPLNSSKQRCVVFRSRSSNATSYQVGIDVDICHSDPGRQWNTLAPQIRKRNLQLRQYGLVQSIGRLDRVLVHNRYIDENSADVSVGRSLITRTSSSLGNV